jgi:hypothetical protein
MVLVNLRVLLPGSIRGSINGHRLLVDDLVSQARKYLGVRTFWHGRYRWDAQTNAETMVATSRNAVSHRVSGAGGA